VGDHGTEDVEMSALYKLTDQNMRTHGGYQWELGKRRIAKGVSGQPLCSDGWLHAYEDWRLALFLNPIHAGFHSPRLFEASGKIGKREGQLKCGCRALTLVREMEFIAPTTNQRVAFAIYCGQTVPKPQEWNGWASRWLSGEDRSAASAYAADAYAVAAAAYAAAAAAAAAAYAAAAAAAADAYAAAAYAANAAAHAHASAAALDLFAIAKRAMEFEA
jgi:hypothetical protein